METVCVAVRIAYRLCAPLIQIGDCQMSGGGDPTGGDEDADADDEEEEEYGGRHR